MKMKIRIKQTRNKFMFKFEKIEINEIRQWRIGKEKNEFQL